MESLQTMQFYLFSSFTYTFHQVEKLFLPIYVRATNDSRTYEANSDIILSMIRLCHTAILVDQRTAENRIWIIYKLI